MTQRNPQAKGYWWTILLLQPCDIEEQVRERSRTLHELYRTLRQPYRTLQETYGTLQEPYGSFREAYGSLRERCVNGELSKTKCFS